MVRPIRARKPPGPSRSRHVPDARLRIRRAEPIGTSSVPGWKASSARDSVDLSAPITILDKTNIYNRRQRRPAVGFTSPAEAEAGVDADSWCRTVRRAAAHRVRRGAFRVGAALLVTGARSGTGPSASAGTPRAGRTLTAVHGAGDRWRSVGLAAVMIHAARATTAARSRPSVADNSRTALAAASSSAAPGASVTGRARATRTCSTLARDARAGVAAGPGAAEPSRTTPAR